MILNKVDLVPAALVTAWKHYFNENFPELKVITFTSIPRDKQEAENMQNKPGKGMSFSDFVTLYKAIL